MTTPEPDALIPAAPPDTLRFMVWNLLNGGVDKGSEARLIDQLGLIGACGPDVLCLPEATFWHQHEQRLLRLATGTLGLKVVTLAKTRVGDGKNRTALLYNPASVRLVNWQLRGVGVFHHALIRAKFRRQAAGNDPTGDFTVFGTHLNPFNGEARLGETRGWLTDHGGQFPGLPQRSVALADFNTPRPRTRELERGAHERAQPLQARPGGRLIRRHGPTRSARTAQLRLAGPPRRPGRCPAADCGPLLLQRAGALGPGLRAPRWPGPRRGLDAPVP